MLRSKKKKVNGLLLGIVVCLLAVTLIGIRLNVFGYNSASSQTSTRTSTMPKLRVQLASGPNCSVYVHTIKWRNTIDLDTNSRDKTNTNYAVRYPTLRLGIYIRDIKKNSLKTVTTIPIDVPKQSLLTPSKHTQEDFIPEIYQDAKDTKQRQLTTKHNYLFSLINANDDLWDDIEDGKKDFIFKIRGHYRRDNSYVDWYKQSTNKKLSSKLRQKYRDLVNYQNHKSSKRVKMLKIFYEEDDSKDALKHLDFYDKDQTNRVSCSEADQSDVLPDNWDKLSIAEKIRLNPYKCPDVTLMKSNGRCLPAEPTSDDEDDAGKTRVSLKISAERQISEDEETAEYVVTLDEPEGMGIGEVRIQYKIIWRYDKCDANASWDESLTEDNMKVHNDLDIMDVHFDRWKDKPDHLVLEKDAVNEDLQFTNRKKFCFKVSKQSNTDNIYISDYATTYIDEWWLNCIYYPFKICWVV